MTTTNYYDTFISIADDSPVTSGQAPPVRDPKTAAQIEYDMLNNDPYKYTSDDVLFVVNGKRRNIAREDFFSKGQPCFRSSPLTQRYGWGVHSNNEGKIAIYSVDSKEYKQYSDDAKLKQLKAMRSKRA